MDAMIALLPDNTAVSCGSFRIGRAAGWRRAACAAALGLLIPAGAGAGQQTARIPADALLLPVPFWGPFEAVSQRLKDAPAGSTLNTYDLQTSTPIQVGTSGAETIDVGGRAIHARRTSIQFLIPAGTPL